MTEKVGHPNDAQDDEFQHDLNPQPMAGQNAGLAAHDAEKNAPTAYDMKELHAVLSDYTNDEMRQIVVLPHGTRLEQGAKYIDLKDPDRQEITAMGNMEATLDNWYVPKTEVDYQLWNRLKGGEPGVMGESSLS